MQRVLSPGRRHAARTGRDQIAPLWISSRASFRTVSLSAEPKTQGNPILKAPAQDPHLSLIDGTYYYCESTPEGIFLRVAEDFLELARAPRIRVWAPAKTGLASKNIWAPELHVSAGRCYIYFAADDGNNARHRMWVLESKTSHPLSRYELKGALNTQGWAIDGTLFTSRSGELFFVWSGWPGATDGQQNLYIAPMSDPLHIAGPRQLLCSPDRSWERQGMPICEGPQILRRGLKTFLVYSGSASWTADYCLGMLVHESDDLLNPKAWKKIGKVFGSNQHAWGVGHCGFLSTPEGEDWIFYHAKTSRRAGWADREVRGQVHSWTKDGIPDFGEPRSRSTPLVREREDFRKSA